jgi:hypothetical protein
MKRNNPSPSNNDHDGDERLTNEYITLTLELEELRGELERLEEPRYYRIRDMLYPEQPVLAGSTEEEHVMAALFEEAVQEMARKQAELQEQGYLEFDDGDSIENAFEAQCLRGAIGEREARLEELDALHAFATSFSLEDIIGNKGDL